VRRIRFEGGDAFFKACGPNGRHEPQLLIWLSQRWEDFVPGLLGVDPERSWILMADAGTPLRESLDISRQLPALCRVLTSYAQIQIASLSSVEYLLRLGLPDRRLQQLPRLLEELISSDVLTIGRSPSSLRKLRSDVSRALPDFARQCDQLAASPYSAALDHGDLHLGNVLGAGGASRLCDWGDSCLTHPFCSMGVTLEVALDPVPVHARTAYAAQLRDAYLAPWQSLASLDQLRPEFRTALGVAQVVRALDFAHMFRDADPESLSRWQPLIADRLEKWVSLSYGSPPDL
jgi:hypothetical protein